MSISFECYTLFRLVATVQIYCNCTMNSSSFLGDPVGVYMWATVGFWTSTRWSPSLSMQFVHRAKNMHSLGLCVYFEAERVLDSRKTLSSRLHDYGWSRFVFPLKDDTCCHKGRWTRNSILVSGSCVTMETPIMWQSRYCLTFLSS